MSTKSAEMKTIQEKFPVGMKVRITNSYDEEIIGVTGVVVEHECDEGHFSSPMVVVRYARPNQERHPPRLDTCSFYDDEIAPAIPEEADQKSRRLRVVELVKRMEDAMYEIVTLANTFNDVDELITAFYPFEGDLDELTHCVIKWRSHMEIDRS